jgi:hypothetical protein
VNNTTLIDNETALLIGSISRAVLHLKATVVQQR